MDIRLSITVSDSIVQSQHKSLVIRLSEQLQSQFSEKVYSEMVERMLVGFIMVLDRPGYETWYKPKRINYVEYKIVKSPLTGEMIEKRKLLTGEIRLTETQLGKFLKGPDAFSKVILLDELINYLQSVKLPLKVGSFDKAGLIRDIQIVGSAISIEQMPSA